MCTKCGEAALDRSDISNFRSRNTSVNTDESKASKVSVAWIVLESVRLMHLVTRETFCKEKKL